MTVMKKWVNVTVRIYCQLILNQSKSVSLFAVLFCLSADLNWFSDITDSDADKKRRGLRRSQHQQVNYREMSESSDNSWASTNREKVKSRSRLRKENLSSDYSDGPLLLW